MKLRYIGFICMISIFISCEDVVEIDLEEVEPFMNVDAWLKNTSDTQKIVLNYIQPYFDEGRPSAVLNAFVTVTDSDNGASYNFLDADADGIYEWVPPADSLFGIVGHGYSLEIVFEGVTYSAFTRMNPVPSIDSITFEYNVEDAFFEEDWYFGEFWARDIPGPGNTYWIKAYKNGDLLSDPDELNIAYDAGFSAGAEVDSLIFIQPIRTAVNPFGDDPPFDSPYTFGDTLRVEIHGISPEAWFFLLRVQNETQRLEGFAQLFADPLANAPTNIRTSDPNVSVVGFFDVAGFSVLEEVMDDDNIVDRLPD